VQNIRQLEAALHRESQYHKASFCSKTCPF
jgi:hypothetical protein